MSEIADYLRNHGLPPLPVHYASAWAALGGPPDHVAAPPVDPGDDPCGEALERLMIDAQATLDGMASVLTRSQADASAYGTALETEAAAPTHSPHALDMLVGLTRTMIDRTRDADRQIRAMGTEMDTLQEHLAEARTVATRDSLTGLDNRRGIEARLDAALPEPMAATSDLEPDVPVVLAYCDIDNFKGINDRLGHAVGDRVLKTVARILIDGVGPRGYVGRYGGEEFLMVFHGVPPAEVQARVEALRGDLESRTLRVRGTGDPIGTVTFSAGMCHWQRGDTRETLLRRADVALYRAKHGGRNRIEHG